MAHFICLCATILIFFFSLAKPELNDYYGAYHTVNSKPKPFGCKTGNPIDDCWKCDPNWRYNRTSLAFCGVGFGKNAFGGKDGRQYVVTDSSDDNPTSPKPGTIRHAVIQKEPLWIIFPEDMVITLNRELIFNSYKTIDGRGAKVEITGRGCLMLKNVSNIIIHNVHIHDCSTGGNTMVRLTPEHYGYRGESGGDGISLYGSSNIWIDHCMLSMCKDRLIDIATGSTSVTISNNVFHNHKEAMLLGHSDEFALDKEMKVTIVFNKFGPHTVQCVPPATHGVFLTAYHVYKGWRMYATGGSANAIVYSHHNIYDASNDENSKQVTKREDLDGNVWNWILEDDDTLCNGPTFVGDPNAAHGLIDWNMPFMDPALRTELLTLHPGLLSSPYNEFETRRILAKAHYDSSCHQHLKKWEWAVIIILALAIIGAIIGFQCFCCK